jgi:uncharacterized protein
MYFGGQGITKDHTKAFDLFQQAAVHGNEDAQYRLGRMFARGDGTAVDPIQAYAWLSCAKALGVDDVAKYLESVARKIKPNDKAKAQALAKKYIAIYVVPFQS